MGALAALDLSDNAFSGPIPAELGSIGGLGILDLSSNELSGPIPAGLGSLAQLSELDLSFNELSGPVPAGLGSLSRLRILDLAGNDLTGPIPSGLGSLAQLRVLRISGDGLTGSIPAALSSLTNLTELHIDGGGLTGAIPAGLGSLTNLTRLHIGGGSLTGAIPAGLGSLTSLESLYVSAPNLSGTLPAQLSSLTSLETLWIKSGSLTGAIPAGYGSLTSLETLYLSGGGLTGAVPAWTSTLTSLKRLYLHNNDLTGPIPAALGDLEGLTTLWLAGNNLKGDIPAQLGDSSTLQTLDVRDNPLTWPPPANLTEPPASLTVLLPDTARWLAPAPTEVSAEPADASLTVTWTHPGAGTGYQVDTYTINHRAAGATGDFTQTTATESPATVDGLTNGTAYDIFVTATNPSGTSAPSTTIQATPTATTDGADGAGRGPREHATDYYTDIEDSNLEDHIAALAQHGIFDGTDCDPANERLFCPNRPIKRWEAAVWFTQEINAGTAPAMTNSFDDVADDASYKNHVNWAVNDGIMTTCERRRFCPNAQVRRDEMATMLVNAYGPLPNIGAAPAFTDIAGNPHRDAIIDIAEAEITAGCRTTPPQYCPAGAAIRAHMAAFLNRTRNIRPPPPITVQPPTTPRPPAPTAAAATPAGPGELRVTWTPGQVTQGTTAATSWRITYNPYRLLPHPHGSTRRVDDPAQSETFAAADVDPSVGVIIDGLRFDAHYAITIRGTTTTTAVGDPSPEATATTDPAAVRLVALEVTQGLQTWNSGRGFDSGVTLVKGKQTVVRVFLEPVGTGRTPVHVRLTAIRGDRTLEGSPYTVNGVSSPQPPQTAPAGVYFVATDGVIAQRGDLGVSLNFLLPASLSSWVGSTATSGDFEITYRVDVAEGVDCVGAPAQGGGCVQSFTFEHVDPASIVVVPLTYNNVTPTDAMIEEQRRRIESLMPIPSLTAHIHAMTLGVTSGQHSSDIIATIDAESDVNGVVHVGIMNDPSPDSDYRGGARAQVRTAWWNIRGTAAVSDAGYSRNVGSHEMGHILGWPHAAYSRPVFLLPMPVFVWTTACDPERGPARRGSEVAAPELFPYFDPVPTRSAPADVTSRAALGPLGDAYAEAWGLDTRFVRRLADGTFSPLAVQDPNSVSSLMSACSRAPGTQVQWVDMFFHSRFVESLMDFDWGDAAGDNDLRDVLVVSGSRRGESGGTAAAVSVDPVYTYSTRSRVVEPRAGDWRLDLLDSGGQVLRSVSFTASVEEFQTPAGGALRESFRVAVADPPRYQSLRIVRDEDTVAEVAKSPSAPVVSVDAPTAGQVFSGNRVTVSWTATDADEDDLSYRVYYSTDAGADYKPVAAGVTSTSVTLDRSRLAGSTQARIRVIATDGTRSTAAQSPVFTVAASRPRVMIHSPAPGQVLAGGDILVLDASALDAEDGTVAGAAIVWTSSIDGPIADGAVALVGTGELAAGTHTLTATATDSDNMTASATVTVVVRATNTPPSPADDIAHLPTGAEAIIDVVANDTDPDRDIAARSLTVAVPPSAGTHRLDRVVPGSATVAYRSDTSGYDTLIYEVCDRLWQCASAEATIVVLDDL